MNNEFQERAAHEQAKQESESINFLVQEMKKLVEAVKEIKKEVRATREDLRNVDKLRPLRTKEEEEGQV